LFWKITSESVAGVPTHEAKMTATVSTVNKESIFFNLFSSYFF